MVYLGDIGKYKYLTDNKILPTQQSKIIGEAELTYYPHEKTIQRKKLKSSSYLKLY